MQGKAKTARYYREECVKNFARANKETNECKYLTLVLLRCAYATSVIAVYVYRGPCTLIYEDKVIFIKHANDHSISVRPLYMPGCLSRHR